MEDEIKGGALGNILTGSLTPNGEQVEDEWRMTVKEECWATSWKVLACPKEVTQKGGSTH